MEVETQGALMCGFYAAEAAFMELDGQSGFDQYTRWWQQAFEFNGPDALRVAQGYALTPTYNDDELDYLFGLVEGEMLPGSYSQYHTPKYMWDAILVTHSEDRIRAAGPSGKNRQPACSARSMTRCKNASRHTETYHDTSD